jgi:hypothetical protein
VFVVMIAWGICYYIEKSFETKSRFNDAREFEKGERRFVEQSNKSDSNSPQIRGEPPT